MDNSMSTTADRLNYLENTKLAIKQALTDKGVTVSDSDTFRSYANKIDEIQSGGGGLVEGVKEPVELSAGATKEIWYRRAITKLDLGNCTIDTLPTYYSFTFDGYINLETLTFPQGWDTSEVTDMATMFNNCSNLTSIDLSNWNTSKVTTMGSMFNNCSSLTSLDLSSFDTSKVTYMYSMFQDCSSLTSIDVSSFNTLKVYRIDNMFKNCKSLTSLNLSNFSTPSCTDMSQLFYGCSNLTSLDLSSFDTSKVTSLWFMFDSCSNLTSLDLSSFNTTACTDMQWMFSGCRKLKDVTWGNNWASNSAITSFDVSPCPLSHDSCLDLFNKLATKSSNATLKLSTTTKGYMSEEEIAIATNKGWTVS